MKNTKQNHNNLFEMLSELDDHRRPQGRMHELGMLLIIAIMAVMSGYHDLRAMKDFITKNREELIQLFKPKKDRLPSRQTIGRVIQNIGFDKLSEIFQNWAISTTDIKADEWLSNDGKAIGGTVSNFDNKKQNFVNLVSIFASKQKQVILVGKINNNKESEIPKLKELIKILHLEGVVFTIDALHCQKNTVKTIIESKNDYCIGVKGNQKKLHEQLKKT